MQADANDVRVNDALNRLVQVRMKQQVEALSLQGRNALERPDNKSLADEYSEKFGESAREIEDGLGNDAQRAKFKTQAMALNNQFRGILNTHMLRQQEVFANETDESVVKTGQTQGALFAGDPAMRKQSAGAITAAVSSMAKRHGWDDATREAKLTEAMSPMHMGVIKSLVQAGRAEDAKAYYDENSAGMTLQVRATAQEVVQQAANVQMAEGNVDTVWSKLGPTSANEPVRLFDMEEMLRKQPELVGNADAMTKAITSLRQRAQAFNAQQTEQNAGNVNSVFKMIDQGVPMATVMMSDQWNDLPGKNQHDILKAIESEQYTREARLAAQASRAAANSQRELADLQRTERLNFMRNGDKFLTATDPDVLAKMTRAQVEALRVDFGMEPTQHLLAKWDALQKPGKIAEARIDTQDFNAVADQMGLKPFDPTKNEAQRRALGTLQFRVEQLIDSEQSKVKAPLTREQKMTLMRQELARTVEIEEWGRNPQVPVIMLTPEQAKSVVIPPGDRARIAAKMAERYKATGGDSRFAPTDANLRHWYLMSKSGSASMIPDAK